MCADIHPQTLHPAGEGSSRRWFTELTKQKSDLVERSSLRARVGGHDADFLHPQPCRELHGIITTGPSATTSIKSVHPDHRGPSAVVLSTYVVPTFVPAPAPAGNCMEAESNIDPSTHLPGRKAQRPRNPKSISL